MGFGSGKCERIPGSESRGLTAIRRNPAAAQPVQRALSFGTKPSAAEFLMLAPLWLLTIGIVTGLVTRSMASGNGYGRVADALLGITGAFAVDWILGVLTDTPIAWSRSTLFTIWGAALLPHLA